MKWAGIKTDYPIASGIPWFLPTRTGLFDDLNPEIGRAWDDWVGKNVDDFKDWAEKKWGDFEDFTEDTWNDFSDWLGKNWDDFQDKLDKNWDAFEKDLLDALIDLSKKLKEIGDAVWELFQKARDWIQPVDPLALDLDGDGLETVGIGGSATILFDHNGDGIKTGTGWLKGDDAFLALDKNGNGTIDNGNELFGIDTVKSNGQKATDGFDALSDLDTNGDGVFDANDAQFANLRVWRDLNQDGISQTNELQTLSQAGIASINLTSTATNTTLAGGNVMTAQGTYTKTNGQTGTIGEFETSGETGEENDQTSGNAGNLDLANNPFYREFTDPLQLTEAAAALPDLHGSGAVRDLREAATLDATLVADIQSLEGLTRGQMMSQLDILLAHWAGTADFETSNERVADMVDIPALPDYEMSIRYRVPGMTDLEFTAMGLEDCPGGGGSLFTIKNISGFDQAHYAQMKAESERVAKMLDVLETFNGQTFLDFPDDGGVSLGNGQRFNIVNPGQAHGVTGWGVVSPVLSAQHIQLLQQSYDALKQSVYDALALQTRLKGYLDTVGLIIDEDGIQFDFSGVDAAIDALAQTDHVNAFIDCLDLINVLASAGWNGHGKLGTMIEAAAENGELDALKAEIALAFANDPAGVPINIGSNGDDTLTARAGGDILFGGAGSDTLTGGSGADTLIGGQGNDTLRGNGGDDLYLFSKGDGQDIINDSQGSHTIRFLDTNLGDIRLERSGYDLKICYGESDSVTIQYHFSSASYQMANYVFADGKTLTPAELFAQSPLYQADGTSSLTGANGENTLMGGNSTNDTLTGGSGADTLIGGQGNDSLQGKGGDDLYLFSKGDGQDTIYDYQGSNTIRFLDVNSDDIRLERSGYDLKLCYGESDSVTIQYHFSGASYQMANYEFADVTLVGVDLAEMYGM